MKIEEPEAKNLMADENPISNATEQEYLRYDEIVAAFDTLACDEKMKLHAIEATLRSGTKFEQGELLHEALYRALEGTRKCPKGTSILAFLVMTMKSISSHDRDKSRREVLVADPTETPIASVTDLSPVPSPEDDAIAVEDDAIAETVLQEIYHHFEDDEEATMVLMGWADGLRGVKLREVTGLDQAAVDYAAKRVRAGARKLRPDGWKA